MRWEYCEPDDAEVAQRAAVLDRIDRWWAAFEANESKIRALFKWDLAQWVHDNLNAIDPRLMWEFGPAVNCEGHRLVVTPESEKQLRPLVSVILNRAPKPDGWEFYAYRLPESAEQAALALKGRTGGDLNDLSVKVKLAEHHRIDLAYSSSRCNAANDQQSLHDAFTATEELLGEELLDKWIGAIEVNPPVRKSKLPSLFAKKPVSSVPMSRLAPTVQSLVDSVHDQLHSKPLCEINLRSDEHAWTCFERKPQQSLNDYPNRSDLLVLISGYPAMSWAALNDAAFCSQRFSRFGETFCYLKIDGVGGLPGFGGRDELETAIDEALVPLNLGRTVGGGTGLRYSYVELSLTSVRRAVEELRSALGGKMPIRSWLLFFEPEMADEWVGLSKDTLPPPR